MKYLSNYTDTKISKALDKAQAFFAFSDKQVEEGKAKQGLTDDIKLVSLGMGMICPQDTGKQLLKDIDKAHKDGIAQDIKENGKEAIIKRELCNHEAYYIGEIEQTSDALQNYPFTVQDIQEVYQSEVKARREGKKEFNNDQSNNK